MALSESNVKLEGFDKFAEFECLGEPLSAVTKTIAEDLLIYLYV